MYLQNHRVGFATNSSSSHSLVWTPSRPLGLKHEHWQGEYGWSDFTLMEPRSKIEYFLVRMSKYLPLPEWVTNIFGLDPGVFDALIDTVRIDHQSYAHYLGEELVEALQKRTPLAEQLMRDIYPWLLDDSVVILGGNDNSDGHPAYRQYPLINFMEIIDQAMQGLIDNEAGGIPALRYDNGYWTVFSRKNGTKIKWSFTPGMEQQKSSRPELVDLKITNYCPYGCRYCYQGSTLEGQHASMENIKRIAADLQEVGVYEVALGGGEPTLHPEFDGILKTFRERGIVVSVTTRNYKRVEDIEERIDGKVAISLDTAKDHERITEIIGSVPWDDIRIWHYVMGSTSLGDFEDLLRSLRWRDSITLLGFKTTGFGQGFPAYPYDGWRSVVEKIIMEDNGLSISIDTALAAESDLTGIPPHLYYINEGAFSFYIDAVTMEAGPSSFSPTNMIPYTTTEQVWPQIPVINGKTGMIAKPNRLRSLLARS
jgi:hypothetical protein